MLSKNAQRKHDQALFRTMAWILVSYSLVFCFVLYKGWSILFSQWGSSLATVGALVLAFLAWNIGRFIGSSPGGIASRIPLFILLLVISAYGVINTMVLQFEGPQILREAIQGSLTAFGELNTRGQKAFEVVLLDGKKTELDKRQTDFIREVTNPLNCGLGTQAILALHALMEMMPNLRLPSVPPSGPQGIQRVCDAIGDAFNVSIEQQKGAVPFIIELNAVNSKRATVMTAIDNAQQELKALEKALPGNESSSFILGEARVRLNALQDTYREQVIAIKSFSPAAELTNSLPLEQLSQLGGWSQLVNIIVQRLNRVSTYVYLLLAIFMDWTLIYLFKNYRNAKANQSIAASSSIATSDHL